MNKKTVSVLAALGSMAMLCSCTTQVEPTVMSADTSSAPAGFEEYYSQSVDFVPCKADQISLPVMPAPKDLSPYRCATVTAPMDWTDPASSHIDLAVATYGDPSKQPLFYNLGGPGGDAVQSLSSFVANMAPPALAEHFQFVALDPRGVGASTPVHCWDDSEKDEELANPKTIDDEATPEEIVSAIETEKKEVGTKCLNKTGELLGFVDTVSAAHDFDLVRALLGAPTMDYVGYSYGTALGAVYADMFPEKVGRFVLDSALDPDLTTSEVTSLQAQGMEESLNHWIEYCLEQENCPLSGDVETAKAQLIDFYESLADNPLSTGDPDRPLTESLARTGTIGSLYSEESYPLLLAGLQTAFQGDGWTMLQLADFYNGRNPDGSYANNLDAAASINNLDFGSSNGSIEEWALTAKQLEEDYPVFGDQFGFADAGADEWPVSVKTPRAELHREGGPTILVIGTTHDPATPYVMAESLTQKLGNAVLVTREGWDHGSYTASGSSCITEIADAFLIDGKIPSSGVVCSSE